MTQPDAGPFRAGDSGPRDVGRSGTGGNDHKGVYPLNTGEGDTGMCRILIDRRL